MRRIIMSLFCLINFSLAAETIGNVEFFLPDQSWKIVNETKTDTTVESVTRVYAPTDLEDRAVFIAHINNLPITFGDQKALTDELELGYKTGARLRFTDPQIKFNVIDLSAESAFFEYTVSDDGQEKAHGWMRIFSIPKEGTVLTYETKQIDKVDQIRPIWVKVLQEAKVNNKK